MNRQQGPVAKLLGWLVLAAALGAFALVNYYAFTNPTGGRRATGLLADVPVQYMMVFIDVVFVGGLFLMYRFARKHERAMREAGFEPSEVEDIYWEAYLLRAKAEAERRGGDVRDHLHVDMTKRLAGLAPAGVLSAADIRAAVRQATPISGAPAPVDLMGTWTSRPEASPRPGWTAQVELRETAGSYRARLWTWAPSGVREEGESAASVHEGLVEVKRETGGETRVVRLAPGAAPDSVELDEFRFPSGKPRNMQVKSCTLRKVRA
jgi:hypothetical protein